MYTFGAQFFCAVGLCLTLCGKIVQAETCEQCKLIVANLQFDHTVAHLCENRDVHAYDEEVKKLVDHACAVLKRGKELSPDINEWIAKTNMETICAQAGADCPCPKNRDEGFPPQSLLDLVSEYQEKKRTRSSRLFRFAKSHLTHRMRAKAQTRFMSCIMEIKNQFNDFELGVYKNEGTHGTEDERTPLLTKQDPPRPMQMTRSVHILQQLDPTERSSPKLPKGDREGDNDDWGQFVDIDPSAARPQPSKVPHRRFNKQTLQTIHEVPPQAMKMDERLDTAPNPKPLRPSDGTEKDSGPEMNRVEGKSERPRGSSTIVRKRAGYVHN